MSNKTRSDRIQLLHKVVLKHFTPVVAPTDRSVLEHMLYACCLEDAQYDDADEAFHRLQESFFDWNEIRVTTINELSDALHNLPGPAAAAVRIKQNLQSLFEMRYSFDIDDMIKMNQGKAVQELEQFAGMTKFVLSYVVQNALGGHSIPVSKSVMQILLATDIVSDAEAQKGLAPGVERTVPKPKGAVFASCLHQLAIAVAESPGDKQTKAILKEAGAKEKKPVKPPKKIAKKSTSKQSPKEQPKKATKQVASKPTKTAPPKKATTKKTATTRNPPAKKPSTKNPVVKKAAKKSGKRKPR